MRVYFLLLVACLAITDVRGEARDYSTLSVEEMLGIVLTQHARGIVELRDIIPPPQDDIYLDDLLVKLGPAYNRLSLDEKCEFALFVIAYANLDAGFSLMFMNLVKADAKEIHSRLSRIPDSVLTEQLEMSERAVVNFKRYVYSLKDIDRSWQP